MCQILRVQDADVSTFGSIDQKSVRNCACDSAQLSRGKIHAASAFCTKLNRFTTISSFCSRHSATHRHAGALQEVHDGMCRRWRKGTLHHREEFHARYQGVVPPDGGRWRRRVGSRGPGRHGVLQPGASSSFILKFVADPGGVSEGLSSKKCLNPANFWAMWLQNSEQLQSHPSCPTSTLGLIQIVRSLWFASVADLCRGNLNCFFWRKILTSASSIRCDCISLLTHGLLMSALWSHSSCA